mmetsp:Transcript_18821/g.59809  ORF Transcript_18821/g.59809 Transcript_18821/m.59809 type:complete len:538 (+) Transcript_18821:364-1977(+)
MPLPLHLFQVEVDAALSKILLLEASEQRHVVLCEDLPLRTRDAARQHGHAVHRRRAAPVNEPAVHLPVGVAPEVGIVGVQVWVLEADVPREEAEVEPDVLLEGTRLLHAVCKGREEGLAGEVRGVALLRSVTNKLGQRVRHLLGAPLAALAGLLGHLRGPGEGPQQRRAQVGAPELCRHGVEEAELVPGGQTGLRPHQRVIHLVPHSRLQLEVQILLSQRQTLVGFEGLLLLLAKLDKLGDEDVVGVWPADVREVVLRDPEGEDRPEEAVDRRLLRLVVDGGGALPPVEGVDALLLQPVELLLLLGGQGVPRGAHLHGVGAHVPGHLAEEVPVQLRVLLRVLDREEGLRSGAARGQRAGHRQPLELQDLLNRVVLLEGACGVEGLRQVPLSALLEVVQVHGHRQSVHLAVDHLAGDLLEVLHGELPEGRERLHALTGQLRAAALGLDADRLEVAVHLPAGLAGGAARRLSGDLARHHPVDVGVDVLGVAATWSAPVPSVADPRPRWWLGFLSLLHRQSLLGLGHRSLSWRLLRLRGR